MSVERYSAPVDALPLVLDTNTTEDDPELDAVAAAILAADPDGTRFARAFRRTIDMLLDGQNTGRFRWEQLYKTEKTHAGTLIEINLQREFHFDNGDRMDYRIGGADVDCKFSQTFGGWMIPPEALDHLCLLTWCNDNDGQWSVGLVRIAEHRLRDGKNRDGKRTMTQAGSKTARWLYRNAPLPENVLLQLSPDDIKAIFASSSGQKRVNELFRRALGRRVGRSVVATVAQQFDYMKRVRADGGARTALQPEGILILGQYSFDQAVAAALGVAVPQDGESVSVRVAAWKPDDGDVPRAEIDGALWRVAQPDDPPGLAPKLPERSKKKT